MEEKRGTKKRENKQELLKDNFNVHADILIDRAHGANRLSLARIRVEAGSRTRAVIHHQMEEAWCVIQGTGRFHRYLNEETNFSSAILNPGDAVFIPPGYQYWVENTGDEELVFLCCDTPPWPVTDEESLWQGVPDTSETEPQTHNHARNGTKKGEKQMTDKYEYKILVSDSDDESDEETLNGLGEQGWELVNAVADVRASEDDGNDDNGEEQNVPVTVFYFKRKKSY